MVFESVATVCAGLFAGAAVYITFVEHPAAALLARWGRLHAVRSALSLLSFGLFVYRLRYM
jgi:hypothetical protein